jgi:pimeloyl-ACP methyl ester carboxylesterase
VGAPRFADYRDQVRRWCGASPDPVVLIGASLGGLLALSAATRVNAAALLLINPMPPGGMPFDRRDDGVGVVPWASRRRFESTRRAMPDADDAARLHAYRNWRDESVAVLRDACAGIVFDRPACPVRVSVGLLDKTVLPESGRALAEDLGADLEILARGDHLSALLGRAAAEHAESATQWLLNRTTGGGLVG